LARNLAHAAHGAVDGVLLYGSHLHGAGPDRHSALDFVVLVGEYGPFYRALCAGKEIHRPAWLMLALARVLPPNVIAFAPGDGEGGLAKCLVVSRRDLARALGPRPKDHFLLGRLVQAVGLVWSRDVEQEAWLLARIEEARNGVLAWAGPFLPETFDAEALGRTMMEVSYRAEFRPEAANRSEVIFEMQRQHFRTELRPVLEAAAGRGLLLRDGDAYRFAPQRRPRRVAFGRTYFLRSKARVTARWLKHVFTFDKWLPYIVRKVERRTGRAIELTRLERRWPLIFLWPRVIRVLRYRPDREEAP